MASPKNGKIDALELYKRLGEKYPVRRGYVLESEVQIDKGRTIRRADAIAIGVWRSVGLLKGVGFEIKVSRSDWLRELDQVEKAEALIRQCREFYLVVSDPKLIVDGELPDGWGLMVPSGKRLRIARRSAKNNEAELDRYVVSKILERSHLFAPGKQEIAAARKSGFDKGLETGREIHSGNPKAYEQLRDSLEAFEKASGVKISSYGGEQLGEEMKLASLLVGNYNSAAELIRSVDLLGKRLQKRAWELSDELKTLGESDASHSETELEVRD